MNPIVKNLFAVVTGIISGSVVNMGIIMISGSIIPPPEGADVTTLEGLKKALPLFESQHFLMPFLAHAIGTFAGALAAARIAANNKLLFAVIIGGVFLIGGILNIIMLPSPAWFSILDLAWAYLPMGYLAGKLVINKKIDPEIIEEPDSDLD